MNKKEEEEEEQEKGEEEEKNKKKNKNKNKEWERAFQGEDLISSRKWENPMWPEHMERERQETSWREAGTGSARL